MKDERAARGLFARKRLAKDDLVVARLVDRGDPAA
jgi:hypothetical protein